jgi:hypothetical protein
MDIVVRNLHCNEYCWQDSVLAELRSQAELNCKKPDNAEPCKPTQQVWYISSDQEIEFIISSISQNMICLICLQVCLFNITADPCEYNNLVFKFPDVVKVLHCNGVIRREAVQTGSLEGCKVDPSISKYSLSSS